MVLLALGLTTLFNVYIYPTKTNLKLLYKILKSLAFGLKRNDKKDKNSEMLAKASVKILEGDSLSKIKKEEIENFKKIKKIGKRKRKEMPLLFKRVLRHKYLLCCVSSILISPNFFCFFFESLGLLLKRKNLFICNFF
jgi:hypothetical protein